MTPAAPYDEFGLLGDNAAEAGLPFPGPPAVRRLAFTLAAGQAVSDVAEFRRRMPGVRTEVVAGAGHAIQSDQPLALTALVSDFVYGSKGAA
jgi:pimeloyl-ACP methyl ester carboxylesterase